MQLYSMWGLISYLTITVMAFITLPSGNFLTGKLSTGAQAVPPSSYSAAAKPQEADSASRRDSSRTSPRQLLSEDVHQQRGVDIRGGFGERRPSVIYDTENPLFDFNVLVTGYEPFLDHDVNPAKEVAVSLNATCDTVYMSDPHTMRLCYEGVGLPVSAEGSRWTADAYRRSPEMWDGVIHLGFESKAKGLRLETIAANVMSSEDYGYMMNADIPCSKQGTPFRYIHEGSPCILPTTAPLSYLDLRDLVVLLEHSGHVDLVSLETWSRDAGAYYCNDQFYRTLHAIRVDAPAANASDRVTSFVPAMFVHLPEMTVIGRDEMSIMIRFIAQSVMLGTIGLLPNTTSFQ